MKEIEIINELVDSPIINSSQLKKIFASRDSRLQLGEVIQGGIKTLFVKITIPGTSGKRLKGKAPTLGIIGELGGTGIHPHVLGLVSDADGALVALSVALKLIHMKQKGESLMGDIIITTHICPAAPIIPHEPVPFMGSPVDESTLLKYEVDIEMDAIVSIDTSRGNKIINKNGFAITPTVKEGWILKVSDDLLRIMEYTTGSLPAVVPITMQDITPYGNDIYHFNSIMQPCTATKGPVVGVAITSEVSVPGCATGVSNPSQIDMVGRYVIEVAQAFTKGSLSFYDPAEYKKIIKLYGSMKQLQTIPQ